MAHVILAGLSNCFVLQSCLSYLYTFSVVVFDRVLQGSKGHPQAIRSKVADCLQAVL